MMKKILSLFFAGAVLVSCYKASPDEIEIVRLGIVEDTLDAPAEQSQVSVQIISDRDYDYFVEEEVGWMSVFSVTRDEIVLFLQENEGFRRSVNLSISASGRTDRVQVRQEGKWKESIRLSEHAVDVTSDGGKVSLRVVSNLPCDYLYASTYDTGSISNLKLVDNILSFEVLPSTIRDLRTLTVSVSYVDGWGETVEDSIVVTQASYE